MYLILNTSIQRNMYKNIGMFFIENDERKMADGFRADLDKKHIIYEVVRVIDKNVLFLEDHMQRLRNSLKLVGKDIGIVDRIEKAVQILVTGHDFNKNIKIDVYNSDYRCYFIESFYPDETSYLEGVNTTLYRHERSQPEVKQLNMDYKKTIEEIKNGRYFEVLLEDDQGCVIEGSRSNLLYIKDDVIFSAPLEDILNGVTFRNVIKMAEILDINVVYKRIHKDELGFMDACFITGTSIGVLPIKSIDSNLYQVNHPVIEKLIAAYKEFL